MAPRPKMSSYNQRQQDLRRVSSQVAANRSKEEALEKAKDPEVLEQLKMDFIKSPIVERARMIGSAAAQSYSASPAYLLPGTLDLLVKFDPAAAILCVKKEYDNNVCVGVHHNKSPRNEMILQKAFDADPSLITEETFKYAYAATANYLPKTSEEETLAEKLCYSYPKFTKLFRGLEHTDFEQRKKEREAIAKAKELSGDISETPDQQSQQGQSSAPELKP